MNLIGSHTRPSIPVRQYIQLFGLTAGFLTFARLVVPLRIALALALTPAMDKYVVKGFLKKTDGAEEEGGSADTAVAEVCVSRPYLTW